MTKIFKITGMRCVHCASRVESAIKGVRGVTVATVSLDEGCATVEGDYDAAAVAEAIEDSGFECKI